MVLTGQGGTLRAVKTARVILMWDWAHQHRLSSISGSWLSTTPDLFLRGEFCRLLGEIRVAIKSQLCFSRPCLFLQLRGKNGLSFLFIGTALHFSDAFCSFSLVTREERLRASDLLIIHPYAFPDPNWSGWRPKQFFVTQIWISF